MVTELQQALIEMSEAFKASGHIKKRAGIWAVRLDRMKVTPKQLKDALSKLSFECEFFPEWSKVVQKIGKSDQLYPEPSQVRNYFFKQGKNCTECQGEGIVWRWEREIQNGFHQECFFWCACIFGRTMQTRCGYPDYFARVWHHSMVNDYIKHDPLGKTAPDKPFTPVEGTGFKPLGDVLAISTGLPEMAKNTEFKFD